MLVKQRLKNLIESALAWQRLVVEYSHKEGIDSDEYKRAERDLNEAQYRIEELLEYVTVQDHD